MNTLEQKIQSDSIQAMKNKDKVKSETLKSIKTAIMEVKTAVGGKSEIPSLDNYATKDEIPSGVQNYVLHNGSPSYIYVPQGEEQIDFNILVSFVKKILDSEVRIDEDIQQFINDNFWDML